MNDSNNKQSEAQELQNIYISLFREIYKKSHQKNFNYQSINKL
jgi:hypothetical protein